MTNAMKTATVLAQTSFSKAKVECIMEKRAVTWLRVYGNEVWSKVYNTNEQRATIKRS